MMKEFNLVLLGPKKKELSPKDSKNVKERISHYIGKGMLEVLARLNVVKLYEEDRISLSIKVKHK